MSAAPLAREAPDAPRDVVLQATKLAVGYNGRALLPPLSFTLCKRELWALVGKNGGGKSTTLKTLLGLLPRVSGAVTTKSQMTIGYVPQRSEFDLGVPQRVCDVVADGLDRGWSFLRPRSPRRARSVVERVLTETGMAHVIDTPFQALSDGQRQRVLVARALVTDPEILVLDEPTNGMDMAAERASFALFEALSRDRGLALVVVSHHLALLASRATHAILVDKDEGIALAGPLGEVRRAPAFVEYYGAVFETQSESAARRRPA